MMSLYIKIMKNKLNLRQLGYGDCRQDMKEDLTAIVNMLKGDVSRKKISNYIKEYLIKKLN